MGKGRSVQRFVIDEDQLKEIYATAATAGAKVFVEEHKKAERERQSKVLNSAKTLVINYRRFKKMCEKSVYDKDTTNQIDLKEILELMSGSFRNTDFEIASIKQRVVRTKMIMDHVDTMLGVYKKQCEAAVDPEEARRYRVIEALYLKPKPAKIQEVADAEAITVSTIYRDCEKAYRKLAVLFFGIDGAFLQQVGGNRK